MKRILFCISLFALIVCLSTGVSAGKMMIVDFIKTVQAGQTGSEEYSAVFPDKLEVVTANSGYSGQITLYASSGGFYAGYGLSNGIYPNFGYKKANNGMYVVCLSGLTTNAPPIGTYCEKQNEWDDDKKGYGVGYILNEVYTGTADAMTKYYFAELLVMYYVRGNLADPIGAGYGSSGSSFYKNIIGNDSFLIPGTSKTFMQIINGAKEYANTAGTDASITTSDGANVVLDFTLNTSDGYYYSNTITINANKNFTITPDNDKFKVVKDGNKYTFKIKQDDVQEGTTQSFTTKVTVENSYYYAYNYDCPRGQDVAPVRYETQTQSASIVISGSVTREARPAVRIRKIDAAKEYLPDAKFQILNANKQQIDCKVGKVTGKCEWTTVAKFTYIYDLADGTYYLREIEAPNGYMKNNDDMEFTITNGEIFIGNKKKKYIEMVDEFSEVTISKKKLTGNDELSGAWLEILDSNSKKMACTLKKDGEFVEYDRCKWKSGKTPTVIYGLANGTYYLKELSAPSGYKINTEKVKFTVKDGRASAVMYNDISEVDISKKDATGSKELAGAELELLNSKKESMSCKIRENEQLKTLDKCKWTSGTTPMRIYSLKNGTYYLVERLAPEGYVISEEEVVLKVTNGKGSAVMTNQLSGVHISKKGATGSDELPGAKLEIIDASGKAIACDIKENEELKHLGSCAWESGTTPMDIYGLADGTYYIKETQAPNGYELKEEVAELVVHNGAGSATMTNKLSEVEISKRGVSGTNDLEGAKLEILDANKKSIACRMEDNGEIKKFDDCKWTSGTTPKKIYGLSNGTYYINEIEAPSGYKANSEMTKFEVKNGKAALQTIFNQVVVKPTASNKSVVSIILSSLGLAVGIGLVAYYKKRVNHMN